MDSLKHLNSVSDTVTPFELRVTDGLLLYFSFFFNSMECIEGTVLTNSAFKDFMNENRTCLIVDEKNLIA